MKNCTKDCCLSSQHGKVQSAVRRFDTVVVVSPPPLVAATNPTTPTTVPSVVAGVAGGSTVSDIAAAAAVLYRGTIIDDTTEHRRTVDGVPSELELWRSECVADLASVYCLNGGSCFNYTIGNYSLPSCVCAEGFMGERCDHKYTNRSYGSKECALVRIKLLNDYEIFFFLFFFFLFPVVRAFVKVLWVARLQSIQYMTIKLQSNLTRPSTAALRYRATTHKTMMLTYP